ncbi:uncharacterized protein LOC142986701 [Anticarsia gemmatalis]|uniref:uncharacterized protein LOC142986701 n=1 Tax=Anticarsia gemmatalis TaxID=129554 RepID=UPI003F76B334
MSLLALVLIILICNTTFSGSQTTAKRGLLLLYRPLDISRECAFSERLRYDLSFGMGMSDTITLVLKTLNGIDYECNIEIVGETPSVYMVVVIKFPTILLHNCLVNRDAFIVLKKNKCLRLCELIGDRDIFSPYFVITALGRLRFRFLSNSSINSDMNADMYQITGTTARLKPNNASCNNKNETLCVSDRKKFCFTSGVVCDGIKNCGVTDWYDERPSECNLSVEYLSYAPVVAVIAALACAILAAGHILVRCLPPLASSFFIFNVNEDNRLCVDPLLFPPEHTTRPIETVKRVSLIPVFSSSSSNNSSEDDTTRTTVSQPGPSTPVSTKVKVGSKKRSGTVKSMTTRIQETLRAVTLRGKAPQPRSSHSASASDIQTEQV